MVLNLVRRAADGGLELCTPSGQILAEGATIDEFVIAITQQDGPIQESGGGVYTGGPPNGVAPGVLTVEEHARFWELYDPHPFDPLAQPLPVAILRPFPSY